MRDGGLSSSGRPIHPEDSGILIVHSESQNPIHDFVDNGSSSIRMALGLVDYVPRIVECAGCNCLLKIPEASYVIAFRY